jgi:hypothetical protein
MVFKNYEIVWYEGVGGKAPKKASGSFLKKRTKKLLGSWLTLPERSTTAT